MDISRLTIMLVLSFFVGHAYGQDEESDTRTTTTTSTPEGTTTTQVEEYGRDTGPGLGGFFIEPGLRYDSISGDMDYPAPFGSTDIEAEGVGANLRVGFHILDVMFLAAEANYSQMHFSNDGTNRYSADGSAHSYGPTLGFQTPWAGIRVWGTYVAGGEFDPTSNNGIDLKFSDLDGYKVGLGVRFAKFGASVEYQEATYDNIEIQDLGPLSGQTDANLKHTGWIGQISFPISL